MLRKRAQIWILALMLCGLFAGGRNVFAAPKTASATGTPSIFAKSAIAFDARSGKVYYRKNDNLPIPIASTQKLLTALLVIEAGDLERLVTIQPEDTLAEPTKLYLKAGDRYTRRELLHALLIKSANDAALALARDHSGSPDLFSMLMTARTRRLGGRSSVFKNPNGLPAEGQISNARELAAIARTAYLNPTLREIVSKPNYVFTRADGRAIPLRNTNRVLREFPACNGMKTGYTIASGHCLVASAAQNGRHVIAVVLGSNKAHVWNDARSLLEYGLSMPNSPGT